MQTVFYNKNTAFGKAGCLFADDELTILWQQKNKTCALQKATYFTNNIKVRAPQR